MVWCPEYNDFMKRAFSVLIAKESETPEDVEPE